MFVTTIKLDLSPSVALIEIDPVRHNLSDMEIKYLREYIKVEINGVPPHDFSTYEESIKLQRKHFPNLDKAIKELDRKIHVAPLVLKV